MSYTRFNRHENMNGTTRREILDLISELRWSDNDNLVNMLYGLFDGYLYSELQLLALELPTDLGAKIIRVYDICNRFPKMETV